MVIIPLTRGYSTVIDDCDRDLVQYRWTTMVMKTNLYARSKCKEECILLHRIILERKLGQPIPREMYTDHIDGDGLNNRRDNLRLATSSENNVNRRSDNSMSKYRGVYPNGAGWMARIGRKCEYLGTFRTQEEAARAYNDAAREKWGQFARLNSV